MVVLLGMQSHAAEPTAPTAAASLPWPKPGKVMRLWPGDAPGLVAPAKVEEIVNERIRNVSVPELWAFLPEREGKKRAALLICPDWRPRGIPLRRGRRPRHKMARGIQADARSSLTNFP